MTRTTDTFVELDRRVALSESAGANLFISIHADAVDDPILARSARGATIYTLSERASSEAAQALAEKENAADMAGGAYAADAADSGQINGILADLVQRETLNFSAAFQHLLIERMRPAHMLARDPARSAAFKVLRQSQTPTVLIELGFVSNLADAAQMLATDWQKQAATAIASAVIAYADKHGRRAK